MAAQRSDPAAEQSAFAAAYRDGLGLACIAVHRAAAGITVSTIEKNCAEAEVRWWCRRAADAVRIAAAARSTIRRESNAQEISFACTAVEEAARRSGVGLFSDEDIAAQAAEISTRIDAELRKLKESGGLKSVNQAYKAYRLKTSGRGERVLRYDEWMRNYRADLVRQAAAALREL